MSFTKFFCNFIFDIFEKGITIGLGNWEYPSNLKDSGRYNELSNLKSNFSIELLSILSLYFANPARGIFSLGFFKANIFDSYNLILLSYFK